MKTLIFTILLALGMTITASAHGPESLNLKVGKQKTAKQSKLKVKFVSVTEDSRCPVGVNCVWAGNAKVKVEITGSRGGTKVFEFNTTMGPKGDQVDGWAITMVSLTPVPRANATLNPKNYVAKFSIVRLQR